MKLSVVMPAYNAMPYLPEAISSLLGQTFTEFELVVVDDASTDGSREYLRALRDTRIHLTCLDDRVGQGAARNLAFSQCQSAYIAQMDADDISLPDRLRRQVEYLDENQRVGMVGTHVSYMSSMGRVGFDPPLPVSHAAIRKDLMAGRHALVNPTLMFRTETVRRIGGYRIAGAGEDWDFFLRMSEAAMVANLPDTLYLYRIHANSTVSNHIGLLRVRYAHACENARLRLRGEPEIPYSEFCRQQERRPPWVHWAESVDDYAAAGYRRAMTDLLNARPFSGYARLAFSAAIAPRRLAQRLYRTARDLWAV